MAAAENDTVVLWPAAGRDATAETTSPARGGRPPGRTPGHSTTRHDVEQPGLSRRFLLTLLRALSAWNT